MKLRGLDTITKTYVFRVSKIQLIKSIQISQGGVPCIATAYAGQCNQTTCCWREDCFDAVGNTINVTGNA
ncbi:MAG: hypothetical protein NTW85_00005 [Methylococcales bacterium]|nr:hypothetical protein [Methylococcales bacterium]